MTEVFKPDFVKLSADIASILDDNLGGWRNVAFILERIYEQGKVDANPDILEALRRLENAAERRDNVMGDPCRLIEVKAELQAAAKHARTIIAKAEGRT